jgi:hypothetical protein
LNPLERKPSAQTGGFLFRPLRRSAQPDPVLEVVPGAPRWYQEDCRGCETPCEKRIGGVGSVKYRGPFFFSDNVGIEESDAAIKFANHLPDQRDLPLRGFARIKMTWMSHCVLQNEPIARWSARAWGILRECRKNLAKEVGQRKRPQRWTVLRPFKFELPMCRGGIATRLTKSPMRQSFQSRGIANL